VRSPEGGNFGLSGRFNYCSSGCIASKCLFFLLCTFFTRYKQSNSELVFFIRCLERGRSLRVNKKTTVSRHFCLFFSWLVICYRGRSAYRRQDWSTSTNASYSSLHHASWNVGLVVAMTSLTVVFGGWLWEVDLLCSYPSWVVYFVIPVCWPDTRTSVYELRGGTFPDVLRARQVGLAYSLERTAVWLCKPK